MDTKSNIAGAFRSFDELTDRYVLSFFLNSEVGGVVVVRRNRTRPRDTRARAGASGAAASQVQLRTTVRRPRRPRRGGREPEAARLAPACRTWQAAGRRTWAQAPGWLATWWRGPEACRRGRCGRRRRAGGTTWRWPRRRARCRRSRRAHVARARSSRDPCARTSWSVGGRRRGGVLTPVGVLGTPPAAADDDDDFFSATAAIFAVVASSRSAVQL